MDTEVASRRGSAQAERYLVSSDHVHVPALTELDAVMVVDDERHWLQINDFAADLLGTSVDDAIGLRIEHFTPVERWDLLDQVWANFFGAGDLSGTYVVLRGDGARSLVEFRAQRDLAPGEHLISARVISAPAVPAEPSPALPASPLTGRERQVLQLAADGYSTRDIAAALDLGQGIVKTHFKDIHDKLGVRDTTAAVARALRGGVIR